MALSHAELQEQFPLLQPDTIQVVLEDCEDLGPSHVLSLLHEMQQADDGDFAELRISPAEVRAPQHVRINEPLRIVVEGFEAAEVRVELRGPAGSGGPAPRRAVVWAGLPPPYVFVPRAFGVYGVLATGRGGEAPAGAVVAESPVYRYGLALDQCVDAVVWNWDGTWTEGLEQCIMRLLVVMDDYFEALDRSFGPLLAAMSASSDPMLSHSGSSLTLLQSRMEQSIKQALEHHDKTAVGKISHSFVGLLEFSLLGGVHQADFHAAITDFERAKYATSRNKAELAALLVELRGAGTRYYEHLRAAGRQSPGEHAQKLAALAAVCQTRGEVDVFALYRLQHGTLNLQPGAAEGDRLEFLPTVPLATILDDPAGLRQRVDRWAETLFGHAVVPGPHSAPYHISSASPAAVAEGARMLRAVLAAGLAYSSGGANDVVPTLDRFRAALALQAPCEPARAPALRARLREVARMLRGGRRAGRRFSLSVNSDVGLCLVKLAGHHLDSWVGPEMEVVWRHMADAGQMCVFELWYHAPPDGAGPAPAPVLLAADFGHVVGDVVYVATRFYDRGYPKFGSGFLLALAECRVLQQRGFVWWDLGGVDRCPMMAYKRVLTRTIPRPEFLRESEGARAAAAPRALPQGTVVADITEEHLWSGVR